MTLGSGGSVTDLLAKAGRPVPMPDANCEIFSVLLHRDERTRARTLVVRFPAGFSRTAAGRYQAGEELLVLSGELCLAGLRLIAGDWAWLPPRLLRRDLSAEHGALVYAWFSGGNDWEPSEEDYRGPPARTVPVGVIRAEPRKLRGGGVGDGPGSSATVAAGRPVAGPAELLDLSTFAWTRIEADERHVTGPGPAFVRWQEPSAARHPLPGAG